MLTEIEAANFPMCTQVSQVVLIAEDPFVAGFVRTLLRRQGREAVITTAERGLALLQAQDLNPDLVITNTPQEFLPVAGRINLLYLAAMPDPSLIASFPSARSLRKPFSREELLGAVESLLVIR
jgi:DNA-binding NarL/FixJ family response regulator